MSRPEYCFLETSLLKIHLLIEKWLGGPFLQSARTAKQQPFSSWAARLPSVLRPLTSPAAHAGEGVCGAQGPPDLRSSLACRPHCPGLDSQALEAVASAPSAVVGVVPPPGLRLRFPQQTRVRWFYSQCGRAAPLKL